MVVWMWTRGMDPDSSAIPYLTAAGDLIGTALLGIAFHILYAIGDGDSDVGDWSVKFIQCSEFFIMLQILKLFFERPSWEIWFKFADFVMCDTDCDSIINDYHFYCSAFFFWNKAPFDISLYKKGMLRVQIKLSIYLFIKERKRIQYSPILIPLY